MILLGRVFWLVFGGLINFTQSDFLGFCGVFGGLVFGGGWVSLQHTHLGENHIPLFVFRIHPVHSVFDYSQ